MGLVELAFLGGIAWIVIWTIIVFLQTAIYGALSSSTAFASYYVLVTPVDPDQAQAFIDIAGFGISSVEVVVVLLVWATWKLSRKFWEHFGTARGRYLSPFTR